MNLPKKIDFTDREHALTHWSRRCAYAQLDMVEARLSTSSLQRDLHIKNARYWAGRAREEWAVATAD